MTFKQAIIGFLVLAGVFGGATYMDQRAAADRREHERIMAQIRAKDRPYLDGMCKAYFEWSKRMNDRVPGMEKHCAE